MDGNFVNELEQEAVAHLRVLKAERTRAVRSEDYFKHAKISISVIAAYVRLRATLANERSLDLADRRIGAGFQERPALTS